MELGWTQENFWLQRRLNTSFLSLSRHSRWYRTIFFQFWEISMSCHMPSYITINWQTSSGDITKSPLDHAGRVHTEWSWLSRLLWKLLGSGHGFTTSSQACSWRKIRQLRWPVESLHTPQGHGKGKTKSSQAIMTLLIYSCLVSGTFGNLPISSPVTFIWRLTEFWAGWLTSEVYSK